MENILIFIKKYRKEFIILSVILLLGTYLVSYGVLVTSDAYETAREFVYNSEELKNEFGMMQEVKIVPGIKMGGMSHQRGRTRAHYYLHIFSDPNEHMVHVKLEKKDDVWSVTKHEILY